MFRDAGVDLGVYEVLKFFPGASAHKHHAIVNFFRSQGQTGNQIMR